MMLRFSACALALVLCAAPAQAGHLASLLTFDGSPDVLVDDSRSNVYDLDGSLVGDPFTPFTVGDVVSGWMSISDFIPAGDPSPIEVAVLFSAEVKGIAANGTVQLGAVDATANGGANAAYTLSALLDPAFAPVVSAGAPAGATVADAVAVVVSGDTVDPLDPELPSLASFTSADFGYEATLGIDPSSVLTGPATSGDFFHFAPTLIAGLLGGTEAGGFSVFDHTFGGGTVFLPVASPRLDVVAPPGSPVTSTHDVSLFFGAVTPAAIDPAATGAYMFHDDARFAINAVPEPTSVAIWGLIVAGGVVARRRRNKKA